MSVSTFAIYFRGTYISFDVMVLHEVPVYFLQCCFVQKHFDVSLSSRFLFEVFFSSPEEVIVSSFLP